MQPLPIDTGGIAITTAFAKVTTEWPCSAMPVYFGRADNPGVSATIHVSIHIPLATVIAG